METEFLINAAQVAGSYIAIIVAAVFGPNVLSKGLTLTYLRARFSRGKKIIVRAKAMHEIYFKTGKVSDKTISYKDRSGQIHMITPLQGDVYSFAGVPCLDFDEVSNEIIRIEGTRKPGIDTVLIDSVVKRAISLGQMMKPLNEKIILVVLFVLLVVVVIIGIKVFGMSAAVEALAAKGVV